MQIQQVRELIQDYPADKLRLIIGELYKILPKKVIEEKEIDVLLKDPDGFLENRRKNRKAIELPDFEEVKEETELFISLKRRQIGYTEESRNNDLVELVLILQMTLGEYEKAISYFKAHYVDSQAEFPCMFCCGGFSTTD
ncbi:MAG: hypothetical protein AB1556_12495 [Bacillota bacterium]